MRSRRVRVVVVAQHSVQKEEKANAKGRTCARDGEPETRETINVKTTAIRQPSRGGYGMHRADMPLQQGHGTHQ